MSFHESRRAILKMIGMSPVAATSAAAELRGVMSGTTGAMLKGAANAVGPMPLMSPVADLIGHKTFTRIDRLARQTENEVLSVRQYRQDALDPDLAALRSVSRAYKIRKQIERDREAESFFAQVREYLWP